MKAGSLRATSLMLACAAALSAAGHLIPSAGPLPAAASLKPGTAGSDGAAGFQAGPDDSWVRIGVIAASAKGLDGDKPLRYAYRDGERLESMLAGVGQIESGNLFLLKAEGKDEFLKSLSRIGARIAELKAKNRKVFLQFYYSGHGGAKRFHFADGSISFDEVKAALGGERADARVYVLDVCFGASFFNAKGFRTAPPVQLQMEMDQAARGEVTISSSSLDEQAYEVKSLGGSIFTSHWIMALRGAGDRNRDGQVTLFEAYNYAYDRTSGYSAETLDRPQHPSFQMDLTGARDVTLARLLRSSTGILFKGCPVGLYNVVDLQRGIQIGELRVPEGEEFTLALEPGRYRVFYMQGGPLKARAPSQAADLELTNASMATLPFTAFQVQTAAQGMPKGLMEPGADGSGETSLPSGPDAPPPDGREERVPERIGFWSRIGYSAWMGASGFEDGNLSKGMDAERALDGYFGTGGRFAKPALKSDWGLDAIVRSEGAWYAGARLGFSGLEYSREASGTEPLNSLSPAERARYPVRLSTVWGFNDTRYGIFLGRGFQAGRFQGFFAEAGAFSLKRSADGKRILTRTLYETTGRTSMQASGEGYRLEAGVGYRLILPGRLIGRGFAFGLRLSPYYSEVSGMRDDDAGVDLASRESGCAAVLTFNMLGRTGSVNGAGPGRGLK
ncbi:MAG: ActD-like protein [Fibrobacteres bacterium]|nr:ActD-like protein [Fibrobacterota bacterium]